MPSTEAFISMTTFLVLISVFYFIPTGIVILWAPTQIGAGICSILFLSEIIVGAISSSILTDEPFGWRQITGCSLIVIGGIFVGLGTKIGSGCTSGHGICGISRFSFRSIFATLTFMIVAMITVYALKWLGLT